jgi:nucleotide-binding universal stress UspA family protein
MNRILVPTDFSDIANFGIETAIPLAKKMDAQIFLVNFIAPVRGANLNATGAVSGAGISEEARFLMELHKKNEERLSDIAKELSLNELHVTTSVLIKELQSGISDFIDKYEIDLVVAGTSGESTLTEFFVGNHTEQIIRISHCPVLAVKQSHPNLVIKNIVLATDLNPDAFEGVTHIKRFSSYFNAHLHILHVMTDKGTSHAEVTSKLDSFAHRHHFANFSLHCVYASGETEGIFKFAKEKKADLIAVITHGRTGLANLIQGSISEDLVKQANIPVLAAHMSHL